MTLSSNNKEIHDILIIGFGSQAKSWALNLRDSGREVTIGLRSNSQSHALVSTLGFNSLNYDTQKLANYNFIVILTPDDTHKEILTSLNFKDEMFKQSFIYAHGHSVTYDRIGEALSQHQHLLLAPKAIASELRFAYETKSPLTAVVNCEDSALLKLAKDLGISVGPVISSFEEETICDLFSEQSLLCSVIPHAAKLSFEILIEHGHDPKIAYIECWHEVKLIADAMIKFGPSAFHGLISPNAFMGGEKAKSLIFDSNYRLKLKKLYDEIKSGQFADEILHTDFQKLLTQVISDSDKHEITKAYQSFGKKLLKANEEANNKKN